MTSYIVKIFRAGIHVDTQTVQAPDTGKAQSVAMAQTRVMMRGALVTFKVTAC